MTPQNNFLELFSARRAGYLRMMNLLMHIHDMSLAELTPQFVAGLRDRVAEKHGRRQANYVMAVISVACEHGREHGIIRENPVRGIKRVRRDWQAPRANRPWTAAERRGVLQRVPDQLRVPVALAMFTGLRKGDVLRLPKSAIREGRIWRRTAKTGHEMSIPLHPDLVGLLSTAAPHDAITVAATTNGTPWTESGFNSTFIKAIRRLEREGAVQPGLTFDGLGHTVGTLLVEAGFDIDTVRRWLGQKTLAMAIHYSDDRSTKESIGAFVLVSRFPGSRNPTPRSIGEYPSMPLAKAREIAREWREDIWRGIDPKEKEKERQRQEARRKANTFSAAFEAFAEDHLSTLRTGNAVKRKSEKHIYPQWADRSINDIRRSDVNDLIRSFRRDAPIGANRLLAYLKKFFAWAVDQELIDVSPAAAIKKPSKENERDRVLSEGEIRAIWQSCDGPFGRAFKIMLLTGARRNEVGRMTWGEIDGKVWTLPRGRTKADRAHDVPLSDLALSVIAECPKIGTHVFTTGRGAISGWGKAKNKIDAVSGVADWRLHDLRRTCGTYMAKLGTDRVVISKILNHAEGGVTRIYERHGYEHEKRHALDAWAQRVMIIVEPSSNVVPIKA